MPDEGLLWLLQAYETPPFFADDWLNDYYDAKTAARRFPNTTPSEPRPPSESQPPQDSSHSALGKAHAATAAIPAGGHRAAGDSGDLGADTAQAASCIATSDYRFVYLGPKVSCSAGCSNLRSCKCACCRHLQAAVVP